MSRVLQFFIEETGVVKDFAGSTAPSGYLMCFGQAVSRTTYKKLFDVIGSTFGAGDGSTTFNVPDCRGRAAVGKDDMGGTAASRLTTAGGGINGAQLGAAGGAEAHTLTTGQMPAHNHGVNDPGHGHAVSDPGHAHAVSDPGHAHGHNAAAAAPGSSTGGGGFAIYAPAGATINAAVTGIGIQSAGTNVSVQGAATGISTQNNGSGSAHPNVQPGIVFNKIIKT